MPDDRINPDAVAWSRRVWDSLDEGGRWGIPRSGLMFQKRGPALVLISRMPHDDSMPVTPTELAERQESDYEAVARHFTAAGVIVARKIPRGA